MSLNKAVENLKFDKRLLDLNLRLGRVTQDEYNQHLMALTDLESDSENLDLEESDSE
jgi:hypothetical protein